MIVSLRIGRCFLLVLLPVLAVLSLSLKPTPAGEEAWQKLDGGTVTVFYPVGASRTADFVVNETKKAVEKLQSKLGLVDLWPVTVVIIVQPEGKPPFETGPLPEWYAGAARPSEKMVILKTSSAIRFGTADISRTLNHELTHIYLGERTVNQHLPRWFEEGLAMKMAGQYMVWHRLSLSAAAVRGSLMPLSSLEYAFPVDEGDARLAYAASYHFLSRLLHDGGDRSLRILLDGIEAGAGFREAFREAFGQNLSEAERSWRRWLKKRYRFLTYLTGGSMLWLAMSMLIIVLYIWKRRQSFLKLRSMDEEDHPDESWPPGGPFH